MGSELYKENKQYRYSHITRRGVILDIPIY